MITLQLERESFTAMGTLCSLAVTASAFGTARASAALAAGHAEIDACARALSRFDPDSDLSRLNEAGGEWTEVDARLSEALRLAVRAREETDGLYDPTILPALVGAGYDRSFELLDEREPPPLFPDWRAGAEIELADGQARVAGGTTIDLGGIGKGFGAVRALEAMQAEWPAMPGGLADLGGDIAVRGVTPEDGPWRLALADPRTPGATLGVIELEAGGVATSGRDTRRFGPDRSLHHLIDPATGLPAASGPLAVTVVAPDAVAADATATALAVTAIGAAAAYVEARPNLGAVLVPDEGDAIVLGHLPIAVAA